MNRKPDWVTNTLENLKKSDVTQLVLSSTHFLKSCWKILLYYSLLNQKIYLKIMAQNIFKISNIFVYVYNPRLCYQNGFLILLFFSPFFKMQY